MKLRSGGLRDPCYLATRGRTSRGSNSTSGEAARLFGPESTVVLPDGTARSALKVVKFHEDNTCVWQALRRETDNEPLAHVAARLTRPVRKP